MEKFLNFNNNDNNTDKTQGRSLNQKVSKIMDIKTFEEGVRKGLYSDSKGTAYLILNGTLYTTYNVYIDRRCITKSGAVVSFDGLLKTYSPDEIAIRYDLKEEKLPTRNLYRDNRK